MHGCNRGSSSGDVYFLVNATACSNGLATICMIVGMLSYNTHAFVKQYQVDLDTTSVPCTHTVKE